MKQYFECLANYNQWMNAAVFEAAAELSNEALMQDRGAFFHSILGTLNHIMVGDILWLQRFLEHDVAFASLAYFRAIEKPRSLDQMLYDDLKAMQPVRQDMDEAILAFVAELNDDIIASALAYKNTQGLSFKKNMGHLLQHVFNHQTHHRGQVSTLLYQAGVDVGVTDMVVTIPEAE